MTKLTLPRSAVCLTILRLLCVTVVLLAVFWWGFGFMPSARPFVLLLIPILFAGFSAYFALYARCYSVSFDTAYIIVQSGLLIKKTRYFPKTKLLDTTRLSLPLDRRFNLSVVILRAARTVCVLLPMKNSDVDCLLSKESS